MLDEIRAFRGVALSKTEIVSDALTSQDDWCCTIMKTKYEDGIPRVALLSRTPPFAVAHGNLLRPYTSKSRFLGSPSETQ